MAKQPKKPKSKYSAPAPIDPAKDTFFGEGSTEDVFAPEATWTVIDPEEHIRKKIAQSIKDAPRKAAIKKAKKPRTEDEIAATMWASEDEPTKPQPQAVTVIPTPKGQAAVVEVLPNGGVQTIEPSGGVEAIKVTTSPLPDALSVEHTGKFGTPEPKAPKIRFGGTPPTPPSPAPMRTAQPKSNTGGAGMGVAVSAPVDVQATVDVKADAFIGPPKPPSKSDEAGFIDVADSTIAKGVDSVRREGFMFMRKIREKLLGSRGATDQEIESRKALVGLSSRFRNTYELVQQNQALFTELAKDNMQVKSMLARMDDKRMKAIVEKLIEGQEVFPEEGELLIENWEKILDQLDNIGVSIDANFDQMFKSAKQIIADNRVDFNTRRDLIRNIVKIAEEKQEEVSSKEIAKKRMELEELQSQIAEAKADKGEAGQEALENLLEAQQSLKDEIAEMRSMGAESPALKELKAINLDQVNFTKEQTEAIETALSKLEPEVKDIKIQGTMREISDKLSAFVANQRETNELLEKSTEGQMSLKDQLKKMGLGALQDQRKRGLLSVGLSALGLGGVDDLIEDALGYKESFSGAGKGIKSGVGRAVMGGRRLLSKIPGLGKLAPAVTEAAAGTATKAPGILSKIGGLFGRGLGTAAEAATGLPGISKAGGVLAKVGGVLPKAVSGVAGLGSKLMGGVGGKVLGGAGKVLGKLALPLAAAMSAFDAYKGFTEAESVTGKKDNTFLNKTGAAFSSVLSGLSFGVFDKNKMYQSFATIGNSITGTLDEIATVAEDEKLSTMGKVKKVLSSLWASIGSTFSDLGSWIGSWFGKEPKPETMPGTEDVDAIAKAQIKKEEGLNLTQYKDATGKSVGYGHFVKPGEQIPEQITKEDAERLFEQDYEDMKRFVMNRLKVSLAPQQVASLISLGYNAGAGSVSKVIDKLNAGDTEGALETFSSINKSRTTPGGAATVNPVLVSRRAREVEQFTQGINKTATPKPMPVVLDARAKDAAKRDLEKDRSDRQKMSQAIPLLVPGAANQSRATQGAPRITSISDHDLIIVNSGIMG